MSRITGQQKLDILFDYKDDLSLDEGKRAFLEDIAYCGIRFAGMNSDQQRLVNEIYSELESRNNINH